LRAMLERHLAAKGEGASSTCCEKSGFSKQKHPFALAKKTTRKSEKDQFSLGNTIFLQ